MVRSDKYTMEAQSTEEVLSQVDRISEKLCEEGRWGTVATSMDVVALYPSIDQDAAAKDAATAYLESGLTLEDVDVRVASVYVTANTTEEEVVKVRLWRLTPQRLHSKGCKPGVRIKELAGPLSRWERKQKVEDPTGDLDEITAPEPEDTKWSGLGRRYTREEEKRILAKMIEVAMKATFRNHCYGFDG